MISTARNTRGCHGWATQDEIDFIKTMGVSKDSFTRITMLTRYVGSMKLRKDWGKLDRDKVRLAAMNLLDKVKRGVVV